VRQPTRADGVSSSHLLIEHTVPETQLRRAGGPLSPSVDTAVIWKPVSSQSNRAYALISGRHGEDCT
jgi:hypothetical protein